MAYKQLKLYFGKELVDDFIRKFKDQKITFNKSLFKKNTFKDLDNLELKARVKLIGDNLYSNLEGTYEDKLNSLSLILGPENEGSYGTFNEFYWLWPISSVVESHGHSSISHSLDFIYELTKRSTGEFAIRPLIESHTKEVLKFMNACSRDKNFHVRRLSSEGLRPILPWGKKITLFVDKPEPIINILNRLRNDESKYVQTSVANHIGDLLKLNYPFTIQLLREWALDEHKVTNWIIKHGTRNLRKKKHEEVLNLVDTLKD